MMQDVTMTTGRLLESKDLLTMKDMCSLLSCGRNMIYDNMNKGLIPIKPVRVGSRIYWRSDLIRNWLASMNDCQTVRI